MQYFQKTVRTQYFSDMQCFSQIIRFIYRNPRTKIFYSRVECFSAYQRIHREIDLYTHTLLLATSCCSLVGAATTTLPIKSTCTTMSCELPILLLLQQQLRSSTIFLRTCCTQLFRYLWSFWSLHSPLRRTETVASGSHFSSCSLLMRCFCSC